MTTDADINRAESADRGAIVERQSARLAELLSGIHGRNTFYTEKLDAAGVALDTLRLPHDIAELPLTTTIQMKQSHGEQHYKQLF